METTFQRARRPEHKQQRRDAIMEAARTLAVPDGVRGVSLTDIANEVGVYKSAVLRYFETREEIFLRLTAEGWSEWAEAVHGGVVAIPESDRGAETFATLLTQTLVDRALFCDLLAHAPMHLERNVSEAAVEQFKVTTLTAIESLARSASDAVPHLDVTGGRELISAVSSLAGAFWQISHPPAVLVALYAREPALAHTADECAPKMRTLAHALIKGLAAPDHSESTRSTDVF